MALVSGSAMTTTSEAASRSWSRSASHRLLPELALLPADGLAQAEVGLAQRRVQAAREREQQREGVLGEVDADLALLGGQDHVALDQLGREDGVHAGAEAVVVAQPPRRREDLRAHATEQHVGVDDLLALPVGRLRHHEHGVRAGGGEDLGVLLGCERGHQRRDRGVDDLHLRLILRGSVVTSHRGAYTITDEPSATSADPGARANAGANAGP